MANLAKRETPAASGSRRSAFEDNLIRTRTSTDGQTPDVVAPIVGPNQSRARVLADILGVAQDAGEQVVGLLGDQQQRQNKALAGQGAIAGQAGQAADEQLIKKRAYSDAYYTAGAQRTGLELKAQLMQQVQERLNDEDDPATLDDINGLVDHAFASIALDEQGRPRNLGSPQAAASLASILAQTRAEIIPAAVAAIKARTDAKVLDNLAYVAATQGLPEVAPEVAPTAGLIPTPLTAVDPDKAALAPPAKAPEAGPAAQPQAPLGGGVQSLVARMIPITRHSESRNRDRDAKGRLILSPKGAAGAMQVMPATERDPGHGIRPGNGTDEDRNRVGEQLLAAHVAKYNDPAKAWAAYNWGEARVDAAVAKYGDNWLSKAPKETRDYVAKNMAALGDFTAPNAADITFQGPPSQALRKRYDFESLMAQVPPTIDRGTAKKSLVNGLIVYADQAGRPDILDGIWDSKRKDGSPSFTPEEAIRIREAADTIRNRQRSEADKARRDRWEANADQVLAAMVNGQTVTPQTLREGVASGALDPQFAYTVLQHQDAEARQQAAEARADARLAQADADQAIDMDLAGMITARQSGDLRGASAEEDQRRFANGDFGTGKKAAARFRQARAAAAAGARYIEQTPEGAMWAGHISDTYKVVKVGNSLIAKAQGSTGVTPAYRAAAIAAYHSNIQSGMAPAMAAAKVLKDYPVASTANPADVRKALEARRAELQAKR